MNMPKNHKDIVLMADCTRLAKGLRGDRMGDVNLWGHEKRPTLDENDKHSVKTPSQSIIKFSHYQMPTYCNVTLISSMF